MKKILSLFSGCGGMDLGFEGNFKCLRKSINENLHNDWIIRDDDTWVELAPTGFETIFANDIRPDAKRAWVRYFSKKHPNAEEIYHLESIVDLVKKANTGKYQFPEEIDIVTGGFPCQDFSIAGKRLGFNSTKSHNGGKLNSDEPSIENRGQLYMWMRDVISITKPKMFIAENVKGLTDLGNVKEIIEKDFSTAGGNGYLVVPAKVLKAPCYGVPQSRERVFFFGFRKNALSKNAINSLSNTIVSDVYSPYPNPTHGTGLKEYVTCADAFVGLAEPQYSQDASQKVFSKAKFMGTHCQGQTEIKLNHVGPTIRSEHHGNIEFRRLSKVHGGTHIDELNNGFLERRMTVRECARLQTFPDDYEFIFPKTKEESGLYSSDAYKLIGNAVPCVLAYNIAQNIAKKWNLYFEME